MSPDGEAPYDKSMNVISKAFRNAFESHPARVSDPALAVDSARETASALACEYGMTGTFDDATLTFSPDVASS